MATGVVSWSQTASSNATADSAVNAAEGMAPSAVNDSMRGMMASGAKYRDDIAGSLTTGGTSTAYTLTSNQVFASLSAMSGHLLTFKAHTTSGASPTLNVDSLGAKALHSVGGTVLPTGAMVENGIYSATYDNSNSRWVLHGTSGAFAAITATSLNTSGAVTVGNGLTVSTGGAAITGNSTVTGTFGVSSDFAVNTNKFTVTAASGNTAVAGTLAAGATTVTGGMTASGAVSGATAAGSMIATQAEQETGSATDKLVTPGRQHFHASAIKFWLHATVSAGSPTLQTSYNVTSISDGGVGLLGVTIANDFSGTSWCCHVTGESTASQFRHGDIANATMAAGSVTGTCSDGPGGIVDPTSWHISGMGDL